MVDLFRRVFPGLALVAFAAGWLAVVTDTIPAGTGGGDIGPRAFPLLLGVALAVLAVLLVLQDARAAHKAGALSDGPTDAEEGGSFGLVPVLLTFGHIVLYGFLMQTVGFVLATLAVVVSVMVLCVRERSLVRIAAMSVGITVFCWLVFGKILGVYLATGSWISLG